jgi:hypothetical protein
MGHRWLTCGVRLRSWSWDWQHRWRVTVQMLYLMFVRPGSPAFSGQLNLRYFMLRTAGSDTR